MQNGGPSQTRSVECTHAAGIDGQATNSDLFGHCEKYALQETQRLQKGRKSYLEFKLEYASRKQGIREAEQRVGN